VTFTALYNSWSSTQLCCDTSTRGYGN